MKNERNIFRLQCEPRNCNSREDHHARLIQYDDRMRQEEKKYSRLLMELNESRWLDPSSQHKNNELHGFLKFDVDQTGDEGQSAELEVTRLTGDEILYGAGLTMEQALLAKKKPSPLHVDEYLSRTSTQHAMVFQSTLSLQKRNDTHHARIDMNQAVCYDKLESHGKESFPWESVMVESDGHVLQNWKRVCSFSLSTICDRSRDNINVTYHLSSEKYQE